MNPVEETSIHVFKGRKHTKEEKRNQKRHWRERQREKKRAKKAEVVAVCTANNEAVGPVAECAVNNEASVKVLSVQALSRGQIMVNLAISAAAVPLAAILVKLKQRLNQGKMDKSDQSARHNTLKVKDPGKEHQDSRKLTEI